MRGILLFFMLLYTTLSVAQSPRSEYIYYNSLRQLKNYKVTQTDSVLLQINERMGDHDAKIYIPYSKGDKLSIDNAWIEDMTGKVIRKLSGKDIEDRSSINDFSLYEDDFVKSFELKHNQYPYRIFYTYKISYGKSLGIARLDCSDAKQPVRKGKMVVEIPASEPSIKYKQENMDAPVVENLSNMTRYTWNYTYKYKPYEINTAYATAKYPQLTVLPEKFKFGEEGSFESWQSYGNWVSRLNKNKGLLPDSEKQKIDQLLNGISDNKQKARILYHYLQDMNRYVNVNINLGGLQTYPAEYVCINRYGDCKALSNYYKSILDYAGIKSYYTLIFSNERINNLDEQFPDQAFNHVIVTIPFANDTTFVECTSKNIPFGYVHTSIQGRKALLVDETNSRLIALPTLTNKDVVCTRDIKSIVYSSLHSDVNIVMNKRGDDFERFTYLMNDATKNTVDKYIRNSVLSELSELVDFKINKESRDSAFVIFEANCKMSSIGKKYANNIVLYSFPYKLDRYEVPEKRTQDVQIDYPLWYKNNLTYQMTDYTISKAPQNISLETPFGHYKLVFEKQNNNLVVHKEIFIKNQLVPLTEYQKFYDFINSIHNTENKNFYIEIL